jgi:multiple sugar transport system substrate-binding protein
VSTDREKEERMTKKTVSRRGFLRLSGSGLAGAALLGIAGCGRGSESGQKAIGWQAIPSYSTQQNADQARVDYLEEAISQWEKTSGFSINPLVASSDVTAAMARLLEQASQNRAPDISQIDSYILPRFFDYVQPLDDFMGQISLDDYFPFAREIMIAGENVKGLQFTTDVRVLYHRKDIIEEPPASWEELFQVGEEVKNKVQAVFLYPAGRGEATVVTTLLPQFWALGGDLVDDQGNPTFGEGGNRQAMLESLGFIQETVQRGITPQRVSEFTLETDINGDAAAGHTAMFLGGNWQVSLLQEIMGEEEFFSTWGVAPIPSRRGDDHATTAGGWAWGIFAEDDTAQRASVDFLKATFVGDEGMAQWCNIGGYLPPRKSVFDMPNYEGNRYTDTFRDYLDDFARSRPASEAYPKISNALQIAVAEVVSGQKSPEQALQTAVNTVS